MTAAEPRTMVELAAAQAKLRGDRLAYLFLADGDTEAARLTFAEHDAKARRIAAGLLRLASPGDRALLVYEAGLDFLSAFFGCLYAGIIAVPVPAPEASRRQQGLPRLESVAVDCRARLTLCNDYTERLLRGLAANQTLLADTLWVNTETLTDPPGADVTWPEIEPGTIAYLQYTSGSTSTPKGVMISHANLVGHLAMIQTACRYAADSVSVTWMPHFHDYGLIQGMLVPLFNGTPVVLLSPFDFVKHPTRLLRAIGRYRGTHTEGPSFAYAHCLRRGNPEQWRGLDLSSWRNVGNAAEPIHPGTLEDFSRVFAAYGFNATAMAPAYGLAEVTLLATTTPAGEAARVGHFDPAELALDRAVPVPVGTPGARRISASGRPLPRTQVAIVDPQTRRRVAPNRVGEVWVSAPTIPSGYWNRPEESEGTFRARIEGEKSDATWLRTGDLGFLNDGLLHITSRLKDLIIVRGLNHHPQDIEWTVHDAHAALRPGNAAAFSVEGDGEERLALALELQPGSYTEGDLDDIAAQVAEVLSRTHEIPLHAIVLIESGTLLKTSSGKVQRRAMCQAFLKGELRSLRVWSPRPVRPAPPPSGSGGGHGDGMLARAGAATPDAGAKLSRERADGLIAWLRDYAEHRINSRLIDERRCVPPPLVMEFGNRGLFGLQAPERLGGLELRHVDAYRILEQLGAIDLTLATLVFLHNTNGILPLLRFAPAPLSDEFVPRLASGRELAAFALSEPGAGSNVGAVQLRAEPDGPDAWRLHGVKRWNAAAWAGVVTVFARPVGSDGRACGLTAFVLRTDEPGVRPGAESLTMGMRGIMQNTLHLEGARVGRDRILGEPGRGMTVATEVLTAGRISMSAMSLGGSQRCLQLALRYADRRVVESGRLIEDPQTLVPLSELLHRVAAEREILAALAAELDAGGRAEPEAAMALKVLTTDTLNAAADRLVQIMGGRGYMENNLAPQLFRDARMMTIGEGANESLLPAIGRAIRLKEVMTRILDQILGDPDTAGRLGRLAAAAGAGRDARVGRVGCAALGLAAARRLARRNPRHADTLRWAELRLEEAAHELERGTPASRAALPAAELRARVSELTRDIGDLEPLAPDVDFELDPLLRRTPPAADPPADIAGLSIAEKRALLRRLVKPKGGATGVVSENPDGESR